MLAHVHTVVVMRYRHGTGLEVALSGISEETAPAWRRNSHALW